MPGRRVSAPTARLGRAAGRPATSLQKLRGRPGVSGDRVRISRVVSGAEERVTMVCAALSVGRATLRGGCQLFAATETPDCNYQQRTPVTGEPAPKKDERRIPLRRGTPHAMPRPCYKATRD